MDGLVLSRQELSHHVPDHQCDGCGPYRPVLTLLYPRITFNGPIAELVYPVRCPRCPLAEPLRIRLPLLYFGYSLAENARIQSVRKFANPRHSIQVRHAPWIGAERQVQEYGRVLADVCALGRNGVVDADQLLFKMSGPEWEQFLRRAGLDQPGGAAANGEGAR